MSIFGALSAGVSALSAQSQAMGTISDNIANMNTVGYKTTATQFATLVTQARSTTTYTPGGVQATPTALIDKQGLLQSSSSPTDLAVSGKGFFVVNTDSQPTATTGQFLFSRAGHFVPDNEGFLRNAAGHHLQGWPIDSSGNIPSNRNELTVLETVNVNVLSGTATPTTTLALQANLQSSQTPAAYVAGDMSLFATGGGGQAPHFERSVQIFDSKGGPRTLTFGFFRDAALAANQWQVEIYANPSTDVTNANGLLSNTILAFNTDGSLDAGATTVPATLNITTWAAALGIANSTVALDIGTDALTDGITQFDSPSILVSTDANGAVFGSLSGVAINDAGFVTALFDNGTQQDIFQIPLAMFPNFNGLGNKTGNAFIATDVSGPFNLQEAGIGGAGKVAPSSLESSTVDIANEFTKMITTQRAFSAGGRIITTADDMLEELIRLKR